MTCCDAARAAQRLGADQPGTPYTMGEAAGYGAGYERGALDERTASGKTPNLVAADVIATWNRVRGSIFTLTTDAEILALLEELQIDVAHSETDQWGNLVQREESA